MWCCRLVLLCKDIRYDYFALGCVAACVAVSLDTSICTCTSTSILLSVNDAFLSLETDKNSYPLLQLTAVLMGHGHSPTYPALSRSLQHTSSTLYLYVYHRYGLELLRLETAMFATMLTQQSPAQGHQSYSRSTSYSWCHLATITCTSELLWLPQLFLLLAVTAA